MPPSQEMRVFKNKGWKSQEILYKHVLYKKVYHHLKLDFANVTSKKFCFYKFIFFSGSYKIFGINYRISFDIYSNILWNAPIGIKF